MLRAVQIRWWISALPTPTLIGRPSVIAQRIEKFGLRLEQGKELRCGESGKTTPATATSGEPSHRMTERKGITAPIAKIEMRRRLTLIGSCCCTRVKWMD